jgi:serine/threonine protein kinase/Tfp pilus assembly protein PilF
MSPGRPAAKPEVLSLAVIPEHELISPIASGAYGQVWLARNRLGVYRAVKIVHRASFDHDRPFEREFAGIKAFEPISRSHEGLVDLLQVGRDDAAGSFYYIMELADDLNGTALAASSIDSYTPRTLASELKRRGRFSLDECIRIGLSLAEALAHLHKQGLVHRDVKPSNIIFVGGVPKLADVGLVSAVADARSFVGTEGFIPPEGPGTPQADLYSLGIVLYVLSTGKSHQDFPEPPADISAQTDHAQWLEFDSVIHKACQANVRERYRTAQEMREDLALLHRGGSVKQKRATLRRWSFVRSLGSVGIGLTSLMLIWSLFKEAKPGHTPNPEAARLYEHGRWYYHQLTPADHKKALDYLTQATRADPKFVQPYAELTMLYVWNCIGAATEQERLTNTRHFAASAAAIEPNSAEAHLALSYCRFLERDWRGAEAEIVRAIKANPKLAIARDIYSFYLTILERFAEAHREAQLAESLESPEAARVTSIVAAFPYQGERRFDHAIAQLKRVLDLDRNFSWGHFYLGDCYESASNYVAAIEEYRAGALLVGQDSARVAASYDGLRRAYDERGETGYFEKWIELIRADEALPPGQQLFAGWSDLAGCYARLGQKENAFKELEEHFDEPQNWHQIKFIAMYDSLHDDPRYKALVRRAGLEP